MPIEPNALAKRTGPEAPDEADFQALRRALLSSTRGRWFLDEFARRNRSADTQIVLAALDRLEARMAADRAAVEQLHDDLRVLMGAVLDSRRDDNVASKPEESSGLPGLLDQFEHRMGTMIDLPLEPPQVADRAGVPSVTNETNPETARAHLTLVPPPEEPELPIPSPVAPQPPAISVVGTAAFMPSPFDSTPAGPAAIETRPAADLEEAAPTVTAAADFSISEEDLRTLAFPDPISPAPAEAPRVATTAPPAVRMNIEPEIRTEVSAVVEIEIQAGASTATEEFSAPAKVESLPDTDPLAVLETLSANERLALFT